MNKLALWHQAKSEYAYAYDKNTLHIILRTAKNDVDEVSLIHGDPFHWVGTKGSKPTWKHTISSMELRYQTDEFDYYFVAIKPPYLRTKYAFMLKDDNKNYLFGARQARLISKENAYYETYDLNDFFS